jgi:hypothetical protein
MSDTVTEHGEVAGYLAAIREALGDLPAGDRDDLLEDLEAHLHEVVAESGGATLESSLGSPTAYAAELRTSAGLAPSPEGAVPWLRRVGRRVPVAKLRQELGGRLDQPVVRETWQFVTTLRPAWWVARGWVSVFVLVLVVDGAQSGRSEKLLLLPTYSGTGLLAWIVTAVAVVVSVLIGRRTATFPLWARQSLVVLNMVLVLISLAKATEFGRSANDLAGQPQPAPTIGSGLWMNGEQVENIYPYDAQGHPLTGIRLYDQQGRPLEGLATTSAQGFDLVRVLQTDAGGQVVGNDYPLTTGMRPAQAAAEPGALVSAATPMSPDATDRSALAGTVPMATPGVVVRPLPTPWPMSPSRR